MNVLKLIASNSFITVNVEIAKEIGLEAAVVLGELCSSQVYWEKQNGLSEGMFYETAEQIEQKTTLTRYQQAKAIKVLEEFGILDTDLRGLPAKKYFHVNEEVLQSKFLKNFKTGIEETLKQEVKKLEGNNKRDNKKRELIKENNTVVLNSALSEPVKEKVIDFLAYRDEMKKPYKSVRGLKTFVNEVAKQEQLHGATAVIQCIDKSMQNGWQGVFWEKIDGAKEKTGVDAIWDMAFGGQQ